MKPRIPLFIIVLLLGTFCASASIPEGYYQNADGKKYTDLKSALTAIISSHTVLGYSSLWEYYPSTYYWTSDTTRVLDMYSDTERHYSGTAAVSGMNKEHTVPKSWWGGSTGVAPGNDLYNVIPADQSANSRKSNYSVGEVSDQSWTNGVTTIGKGTVNGFSATFFEPADKYKGDFARIYFYMATCYPDLSWDDNNAVAMTNSSSLTLKSWIIPMLMEWNAADPVDAAEIQRNEDVSVCQGNRNPFIDYPVLVDYIWGSKSAEAFNLKDHKPNEGGGSVIVAGTPVFSLAGGTSSSPVTVAKGTVVKVKGSASQAYLHYCINNGDWETKEPAKGYNGSTQTEYYTAPEISVTLDSDTRIQAYCTMEDREASATIDYYYKTVDYTEDYLLYEDFAGITGGNNTSTSGSSSAWSGNSNFTLVSNTYQAGNAVKLGSGKSVGSITSKEMTFAGGDVTVEIGVKGWTTVEGALNVTLTGADSQQTIYTATMSDAFETVTLSFDDVSVNPVITIATTAKRAFINKVAVKAKATSSIEVVPQLFPVVSGCSYNLAGQKVDRKNYKGIVISNGKKVLNK